MNDHPANVAGRLPFLVFVGGSHVLVDSANGRLLVLDEEAVRCWQAWEAGVQPRTPAELAFVGEVARPGAMPPSEAGGEGPRILAQAPLQVAANTSDPNPFSADSGW